MQKNGGFSQYSNNNALDWSKYQDNSVNPDNSGRIENLDNQSSGRNPQDSNIYYNSGVDSNYDGRTPYCYPGYENQNLKNLATGSTSVGGSGNTISN